MTYQGIVFDFNGTLLFDMDLHEIVWRKVAEGHLGRPLAEDEFEHTFVGRTNAEIWPKVLGREVDSAEARTRSEEKEATYRDLLLSTPERIRLVDGAIELFELCLDNNIEIAIGTASGPTNVEFYIETFHLHRWFKPQSIVFDDGTMPGKPHPALFSTAIARLGLVPAQCLVVEDGVLGIQAARAAGAGKVYGIGSDEAGRAKVQAAGVDRVIHTYRDVTLADFR